MNVYSDRLQTEPIKPTFPFYVSQAIVGKDLHCSLDAQDAYSIHVKGESKTIIHLNGKTKLTSLPPVRQHYVTVNTFSTIWRSLICFSCRSLCPAAFTA